MYRPKFKFATAIFLAILGFATVQIRAEIPIVQATDTIFQGFGGGSVTGIVFGPDGNTVILMHNATPTEIDIKTHKVLREFEAVPNATGEDPHMFFNKQKNYLGGTFYSTKYSDGNIFEGEIIWDYLTGKIIKAIPNIILFTDCNMERYYTYFNHNFCSYDFETFKFKDSFNLNSIKSSYVEWGGYGIIPNSNKVLLGLDNYIENESGDKTYLLGELYLLDFDTKKYTKIDIPYESGQKSSEITSISVSETGKYNIVSISIGGLIYQYIYDQNLIFLYKLNSNDFNLLTNLSNIYYSFPIMILNNDYAIFDVASTDLNTYRMFSYDIQNKKIVKYLDFMGFGVYDKVSKRIALYSLYSATNVTVIYSLDALPVIDKTMSVNSIQDVKYQNHSMIITTSISEKCDISITDYNGNVLATQKEVFLQLGINTIKINSPLPNGVYFCVIKTQNESNSYKIMVNN